jgi:hypothetical protein
MPAIAYIGEVINIDSFQHCPFTLSATGTHMGYDEPPLGEIVGGQRDTTFTVTAGTPWLQCQYQGGRLVYRSSDNGGQAWWSLEYGLVTDLDLDLANVLREQISVEVAYKNIPDAVPLEITMISERGTQNEKISSKTKDITGVVKLNEDVTYVFLFSEFGGLNFRDVDYLKFTFNASDSSLNGLDLDIRGDYFCPEPATLLLFSIGGLLLRKRK